MEEYSAWRLTHSGCSINAHGSEWVENVFPNSIHSFFLQVWGLPLCGMRTVLSNDTERTFRQNAIQWKPWSCHEALSETGEHRPGRGPRLTSLVPPKNLGAGNNLETIWSHIFQLSGIPSHTELLYLVWMPSHCYLQFALSQLALLFRWMYFNTPSWNQRSDLLGVDF